MTKEVEHQYTQQPYPTSMPSAPPTYDEAVYHQEALAPQYATPPYPQYAAPSAPGNVSNNYVQVARWKILIILLSQYLVVFRPPLDHRITCRRP